MTNIYLHVLSVAHNINFPRPSRETRIAHSVTVHNQKTLTSKNPPCTTSCLQIKATLKTNINFIIQNSIFVTRKPVFKSTCWTGPYKPRSQRLKLVAKCSHPRIWLIFGYYIYYQHSISKSVFGSIKRNKGNNGLLIQQRRQ